MPVKYCFCFSHSNVWLELGKALGKYSLLRFLAHFYLFLELFKLLFVERVIVALFARFLPLPLEEPFVILFEDTYRITETSHLAPVHLGL